jgi:hypothetical protein
MAIDSLKKSRDSSAVEFSLCRGIAGSRESTVSRMKSLADRSVPRPRSQSRGDRIRHQQAVLVHHVLYADTGAA